MDGILKPKLGVKRKDGLGSGKVKCLLIRFALRVGLVSGVVGTIGLEE